MRLHINFSKKEDAEELEQLRAMLEASIKKRFSLAEVVRMSIRRYKADLQLNQ